MFSFLRYCCLGVFLLSAIPAFGISCKMAALDEIAERSYIQSVQLSRKEKQDEASILDLPNGKAFLERDTEQLVSSVFEVLPKVAPHFSYESLPEIVFVDSRVSFYQARHENISKAAAEATGVKRSLEAFNFSMADFAFYDPFVNRVVFNLNAYALFLSGLSASKEPSVQDYEDGVRIFLAHEVIHSLQESNLSNVVSKMMKSSEEQALPIHIKLEAQAIYFQELFARDIAAPESVRNIQQQYHEILGNKNWMTVEILDLAKSFQDPSTDATLTPLGSMPWPDGVGAQ